MNRVRVLLADPPRCVELTLAPIKVERVARHSALLRELFEGRLSPEDFGRRASSLRPLGGRLRLLDDATAALTVIVKPEATKSNREGPIA